MKIYLDWNCITHLKDKEHSEIRECIMNLKNFCVFPFSDAHFSDLMRSYKEDGSNAYFDYDLELLESVCETNLMLFIKEQDMPMPYIASPKEYFRKSAIDDFKNVELLKDGGFSELVDSLCSDFPWLSKLFVSLLSVKPINIPGNPIIPRFTNVLEATDFALKAFYNQKDLIEKSLIYRIKVLN